MKVLVLNGSPKKNSDTMHITRAFLDGMGDFAPQDVKIINVIEKNIGYCKGCFTCKRNGGACVINDDMADILQDVMNCNVLLLSFPLYNYGMPAPLKALMDRTMPLSAMAMKKVGDRYEHICQADFSRLKYVMICGCGFPNARHNLEPAVAEFSLMFPNNRTVITVPESPMFNARQADAVTKPRLAIIRRAGRQYAETGIVNEDLLKEICSPMIPEETYAKICNGEGKK